MTSEWVLNASAVVRLITLDPIAEDWARSLESIERVIAPELMLTEVSNTLSTLHRANQLRGLDPHDLMVEATRLFE